MPRVRYRIVEHLPERVRTAEFGELTDSQVRLHLSLDDGEVTIVATGTDPRACEALLRKLGATELGVELCG